MKIAVFLLFLAAVSAQEEFDPIMEIFRLLTGFPWPNYPPTTVDRDLVTFWLANRANPDPVELTDENINLVDKSKKTVYIIHGYLANKGHDWYTSMTNEFLKKGDFQIIQVDWSGPAFTIYPKSAQNTRSVGKYVAEHVLKTGVPLNQVHLVGHSLGAHTCGFAGKEIIRLTGQKVERITGMDPAGPLFFLYEEEERLTDKDAKLVDVIHTDGGAFGYLLKIGKVDFYPNGGIPIQKGCPLVPIATPEDIIKLGVNVVICSHMRAIDYFIQSINQPKYQATKCPNYPTYISGLCTLNKKITFGYNMPLDAADGNYYFSAYYP